MSDPVQQTADSEWQGLVKEEFQAVLTYLILQLMQKEMIAKQICVRHRLMPVLQETQLPSTSNKKGPLLCMGANTHTILSLYGQLQGIQFAQGLQQG